MSFEPHHMLHLLLAEGYESATIEPSNITGSPYDYVYVYLTDKNFEGPHIIISSAQEHGERGYVGKYEHYEEEGTCKKVYGYENAIKRVRKLAK